MGIAGGLVLFEWCCCEICCAGCVEGCAFVGAWGAGLVTYSIFGVDGCGTIGDNVGDDVIQSNGADLIPDSVMNIPNGANCDWGTGATYNLLACIAYFGAGVLLCFAPQPKPICCQ